MAEKDKAGWPGLWLWVGLGVALICTTFGAVLFGIYSLYFPNISGVRDDWNVFGALLGGFGSCIGAVATLATLLFLAHQNRKQQDFIQWQIKTQTFDKFLSHRRVFSERLQETQARYGSKIQFRDVENLYLGLFPDNSPTNLELEASPKSSEAFENLLGGLAVRFERLDCLMRKAEWSDGEAYDLAHLLIETYSDLGFEWVEEASDGDIVMSELNTGINIYSLHESLTRMKGVYNVYLRFTGNPAFDGLSQGVSSYVREALMKCRRLRRFVVYKSIPDLNTLQDLLFEIDDLRDESKYWLLPDTYRLLESTFESRRDVAQLKDVNHYLHVLGVGMSEIFSALHKVDEHDERYARLRVCQDSINRIVGNIRQA